MFRIKGNWYGGINQLPDPSKINFDTDYSLVVNGRARANDITPVIGPLDITEGIPTGDDPQTIYGLGSTLFVFAGGKAYYKDYSGASPVWQLVPDLQVTADTQIWCEDIPASSFNFQRQGTDNSDVKSPVTLRGTKNASPAALFVTDGLTQPWIIQRDFSARITKTYSQWTPADPEYVPICKMPYYSPDGILYVVFADLNGVFNQIGRSVTGSPLNFVIIVDTSGNKTPAEADGGVAAVAERVDFDATTFLGSINATDGTFLVTTEKNAYTMTPDLTRLFASEPTFVKQYLFDVGAVNDRSVANVLGDTTVVHSRGIRSFNGVQQAKFQGKFSIFNIKVNRLFEGIVQTVTAATVYENYAAYGVQTIYGYGILWFDMLLDRWVSLDLYDEQVQIEQFATVIAGPVDKLFFLTGDGRVFEAFAGVVQRCQVHLADLLPSTDLMLHKLDAVGLTFTGGDSDGHVAVGYSVDGVYSGSRTAILPKQNLAPDAEVTPLSGQLSLPDGENTRPLEIQMQGLYGLGARVSTVITWNTNAKLLRASIETSEQSQQKLTAALFPAEIKLILIGSDANLTTESTALNLAIKRENPDYVIGLGYHTYLGTAGDIAMRLAPHWEGLHNVGKFYAVPGPGDLQVSDAEPMFQWLLQAPPRYSVFATPYANFFLLNAGIDVSGTQVEPDNLDQATIAASTQAQWLKSRVASSTTRFNFVAIGTPPRSSVAGLGSVAWDAVDFAGISAILSGQGAYERLEDPIRRVYINSGTGGNVLPTFGTPRVDSAQRIAQLGYVRLTLSALTALFEFVSLDGDVLDRRLLQ